MRGLAERSTLELTKSVRGGRQNEAIVRREPASERVEGMRAVTIQPMGAAHDYEPWKATDFVRDAFPPNEPRSTGRSSR